MCHIMENIKCENSQVENLFGGVSAFLSAFFWFFPHCFCLYISQLATTNIRELTCYPIIFQNNLLPCSTYSLHPSLLVSTFAVWYSLSKWMNEWTLETWNCKIFFQNFLKFCFSKFQKWSRKWNMNKKLIMFLKIL